MQPLLNIAMRAARRAGDLIVKSLSRLDSLKIDSKGRNDFVTDIDRKAEADIIATIRRSYPQHAILAEESGRSGTDEFVWIIDPLDGTSNFISGFPFWCVSIAAREAGRMAAAVVWDPLRGEMYAAERGAGAWRNETRLSVTGRPSLDGAYVATGFPFRNREKIDLYLSLFKEVFLHARAIRRAGSAALDLAYVASGVFDGFFEFRLAPWDVAAGSLLIEEAGGRITDFDGGHRYLDSGNVIAGAPGVAAGLLAVADGIVSEDRS